MATRISKEIQTPDEQIEAMATRISKEIKTPDEQISTMATQISKQIKTPEARVNEESLALTLAIKLTQEENLVASKDSTICRFVEPGFCHQRNNKIMKNL